MAANKRVSERIDMRLVDARPRETRTGRAKFEKLKEAASCQLKDDGILHAAY